jgi:hypothetical protein
MLPEDLTEIFLVAWRLCSTTGHERDEQHGQETLQLEHKSHCGLRRAPMPAFRVDAAEHRVT